MAKRTLMVLGSVLICMFAALCAPAKHRWSWTSPRFAACEGVGIIGSFAAHAEAEVAETPDGNAKLVGIEVYAESSSFADAKPSIAARLSVAKDGKELQSIGLVEPSSPAVVRQPGPTESRSVFLPTGRQVSIPKGSKIELQVTATISSSDGSTCVLGTSKHQFDPFS